MQVSARFHMRLGHSITFRSDAEDGVSLAQLADELRDVLAGNEGPYLRVDNVLIRVEDIVYVSLEQARQLPKGI